MWLARKWKDGLFGELMYAEYEYVHECRTLCYTYIDGIPVQPGWTVHSWRSWMNFHYYCTHSLGPVMVITGERPVRVVALPGAQKLAGYLIDSPEAMGGISPSLIEMSNGGLVRNLMGATANDTHVQRLWGTRGAAELGVGKGMQLRLGASGGSPKFEVTPSWDALGELAASTGHGGGRLLGALLLRTADPLRRPGALRCLRRGRRDDPRHSGVSLQPGRRRAAGGAGLPRPCPAREVPRRRLGADAL